MQDMVNDAESSPRLRPNYGPEIKTFGIEVECLALMRISPYHRVRKFGLLSKRSTVDRIAWNPIKELFAAFLNEHYPELQQSVSKKTHHQGADADYKEWIISTDFTLGLNSFEAECLSREGGFKYRSEIQKQVTDAFGAENCSRWFLQTKKDERLAIHREPVQYEWKAVEIISPILPCSAEGLQAVKALYKFLNEHSFVINGSCGFHVHLGNREQALDEEPDEDIPLAAIRRLASVALCAEYQFATLAPACRLDNKYCNLNSTGALEVHQRNAQQAFQLVNDPKMDFEKLIQFMSATAPGIRDKLVRYWHINLLGLKSQRGRANKANTIEVRSGGPTLRASRACNWVRFLTQLFEKAVDEDKDNTWSWLAKYDENTTTDKFLQDLGLDQFIGKLPIWPHTWDEYVEVRDRDPGDFTKPMLPLDGGQASIDINHDYYPINDWTD